MNLAQLHPTRDHGNLQTQPDDGQRGPPLHTKSHWIHQGHLHTAELNLDDMHPRFVGFRDHPLCVIIRRRLVRRHGGEKIWPVQHVWRTVGYGD